MAGRFKRPLGKRPYRKLFIIASEGEKTEPQYFSFFNRKEFNLEFSVRIKCLKGNKNSPAQVLKRMLAHIKEESLRFPTHSGHRFRFNPDTDSDSIRPLFQAAFVTGGRNGSERNLRNIQATLR